LQTLSFDAAALQLISHGFQPILYVETYCPRGRNPPSWEKAEVKCSESAAETPFCKIKECGRTLRSDNTTGFCVEHARPKKPRRESKMSAEELKSQYEAKDGIGLNKLAKLAGVSAKIVRRMLLESGCKVRRPTAALSPSELREFNRAIARKHWDERHCVSKEELAIFRANPNEERDRRILNRVLCRICGVFVVALDPPAHHLKSCHPNITPKEYEGMFPGAPICSPRTEAQRAKGHRRHYWNHRDEMVVKARSYHEQKRKKLAEAERILAQRKVAKKRGPRPAPEENKSYAQIGALVEKQIPIDQKNDRPSIIAARRIVATKTRMQFDVVAQYHKKFRQTHPV